MPGSFGDDLGKFKRKTLNRSDMFIRGVYIKLGTAVIRDTPVGDPDLWKSTKKDDKGRAKPPAGYVGGRLRGNWRISLNNPDLVTFEDDGGETYALNFPTEGTVLGELSSKAMKGTRKDVFWLSNSLPYAHQIEYEGHSQQAPRGMVRRNTIRFQSLVNQQLRSFF